MQRARHAAALVLVALAYFALGKLGLTLALVNASATAVWPPTGVAIAALLLGGRALWPGVFLGAFLVNLSTAGTVTTSLGIATGNTLEGLAGAWLVQRLCGGRQFLDRPTDLLRFTGLAGGVAPAVSASVGVTTLLAGGLVDTERAGAVWTTWWLGDASGALVFTPLVVAWASATPRRWTPAAALEGAVLAVGLLVVSWLVFGGTGLFGREDLALEFLGIPFMLWAALRFGAREAATATVVLSAAALLGTLGGSGPFATDDPNQALLLLQAFIAVVSVMTLTLSAAVAERRAVEEQLARLSSSDGLTGLANYRAFVSTLGAELRRADARRGTVALVLVDVDRLKQVNDQLGHPAGNRVICRVANALHAAGGTAVARIGGDEFAVILAGADRPTAEAAAARVLRAVAGDPEPPGISISTGVAVHPHDARGFDALVDTADRAMYTMKQARRAAQGQATS